MRFSICITASLLCTLIDSRTFADRSTLDETKTELAFRIAQAPVIDGVVEQSEWESAGYHSRSGAKGWFWQVRFDDRQTSDGLPAVEDNIRGGSIGDAGTPPADSSDLGFAIYVGYDDQNLYVGVRVDDNVLIDDSAAPDSSNGTTWLDDSVEVFIDGDNSNFPSRDTTGSNPEVVGTGGQFVITINNAHRDAEAGSPGFGPNAVWYAQAKPRDDGSGYDAEFRISLAKIGNPKFGDVVGFSVAVNDDDDGGNGDRQLIWSGRPHTEESYGNLILGGKSYTAPKVSTAPAIDGAINPSEYAGAQEITVNPYTGIYDLREGDDNFPVGDHGFSAWVVHDSEAIYVAILAVDDIIKNDSSDAEPGEMNGNTWDDDSVEIYFDADDSNDFGRGSLGFEGQYVFTANGAYRVAEANNPAFGANADWFAANRRVATGYSTEFKVKKSGLGNPADGAKLGFHIDMNDDDGNLNGGRKGQIGWSGRSHMEYTYGVLTLEPASSGLSIEKIAVAGAEIEITLRSQAPPAKHALQRRAQVNAGQWSDLSSTFTAGPAGTVVTRIPKPSVAAEFYRALVNP